MAMKWGFVCVVAIAMLGYVCEAQYPWSNTWGVPKKTPPQIQRGPPIQRPKPPKVSPPAPPVPPPQQQETRPPQQAQTPGKTPPQQTTQGKIDFSPPVTWEFPVDPIPEARPTIIPELTAPAPANSVTAVCKEGLVQVQVNKDMFGIGQLIQSADLVMGSCAGVDSGAAVAFEAELQDCGSTLVVEQEELIYIFSFTYVPTPLDGTAIVRTGPADFTVQCHYPRKGQVSSGPLDPTWTPFSATKVAEESLYFSLKLMSDDFMYVRGGDTANQYFLGDLIKIEAAVYQYLHVPLRVHVDACVATLSEDPSSSPRYEFLDNFGCLVDAKLTNSRSSFFPRPSSNKLRFQLEAFMFERAARSGGFGGGGFGGQGKGATPGVQGMTMYITCHLRASTDAHPVDDFHKACSYGANGWAEVLGEHSACRCCDYTCDGRPLPTAGPGYDQTPQKLQQRMRRHVVPDQRTEVETDVTLKLIINEQLE